MQRRAFVGLAAGALGAATLPGCAAFVATPVTPVNGHIRLPLRNHPQLERPGGYVRIRPTSGAPLLYVVTSAPGQYVVLSSVCTHLSCTVNVEGAGLRCPCHGSTFDLEGNVLLGPAALPLSRYRASVSETGELVIEYPEGL